MPDTEPIARGVLESLDDGTVTLAVPGSDYHIRFTLTVPAAEVSTPVGKRIRGRVEAVALRIHPADGGGRFIEPMAGEPRIVAGEILQVDASAHRVLVDVSIPMWMTYHAGQDASVLQPGALVNCYVRSGTTFTPLTA